jgi:hypothetical protein
LPPWNETILERGGEPIDSKADEAENHDAEQHHVHLEALAAGDDQPADTGTDRHEIFRADGGEPGVDQGEMNTGEDRGQCGRQIDQRNELPPIKFEDLADPMSLADVLRIPSTMLSITGMEAASAMNTTFAASSKPNQIEISGIRPAAQSA